MRLCATEINELASIDYLGSSTIIYHRLNVKRHISCLNAVQALRDILCKPRQRCDLSPRLIHLSLVVKAWALKLPNALVHFRLQNCHLFSPSMFPQQSLCLVQLSDKCNVCPRLNAVIAMNLAESAVVIFGSKPALLDVVRSEYWPSSS